MSLVEDVARVTTGGSGPGWIRTRLTLLALVGLSWMLAAVTILPGNTRFAVVSASLLIIAGVGWETLYQAGREWRRGKDRPRPTAGAMTAALAAAAAFGLLISLATDPAPAPATALGTALSTPVPSPSAQSATPARPVAAVNNPRVRVTPIAVHIPKLDAHSSLIELGLDANQRMQTPPVTTPMQAGWYEPGPAPGQTGPAVIVGHVDGANQPGIFHRLHELAPGDRVTIERADGSVVTFVVHRTVHAPKDHFPTREVYGRTAGPELRLITCGGSFDRAARSYRDNVIVFAGIEDERTAMSPHIDGDSHQRHGPLDPATPGGTGN